MTLQFEYAQYCKNQLGYFSYKNTTRFIRESEDTERKLYSETIKVPLSDFSVNCKYIAHTAQLAIANSCVIRKIILTPVTKNIFEILS